MVIVGILFSMISSAQLPIDRHMFMLSNLSTKEGLSSNRVFGIVQDHDGAIWIGTKMGVDRYNGYRVRNYVVSEKAVSAMPAVIHRMSPLRLMDLSLPTIIRDTYLNTILTSTASRNSITCKMS